jgi:hypothetical protein
MHKHIVLNRIKTPDGTILTSWSRHDYKVYKDANGHEYMVDGGQSYLKRGGTDLAPYTELSVYDTDTFELVRESLHWGTMGKDGSKELHWIPMHKMEEDHLRTLIERELGPAWIRAIFQKEIIYRVRGTVPTF